MQAGNLDLFQSPFILEVLKFVILLILFFYAIFALLIARQVDLMSKTLITPVSPVVKAISIIHGGFAVGFIILVFGLL
ncbi:hypothetical protein A3F00_00505 [Candidatus Daviesbacteria bacterium RIFCSPHIGHO2_12_FULL_37_11]|uniref:Uncharacterized protein n=1 Tax=Candidatus Daviesbacteria bacterium RIFCSPHIGHO2_12_FULL_37_11 TaxID=1797777 RepID=A0A1F5KBY0_9BACT|nr:MAG: hypothetical protein A2769_03125 [Candidatus Daviesbacteria bacterium RIFCSPHIGHO2_01_FULL_37_27]OGE38453.1 MAG: hypothetical protein A3F00_00505 [Candidatus Daviesbacteria bacterium RIFCSPHIGHO2_12_FULL_37_11]OGE45763.1 MAG: hypothetical protein A3B39_02595 [Candidatus Daviesbacteria bacterium RIFCSPLOWO2_01_FULL_37_10]